MFRKLLKTMLSVLKEYMSYKIMINKCHTWREWVGLEKRQKMPRIILS